MYAQESKEKRGEKRQKKREVERRQSSTMDQMIYIIPRHSADASRKYLLSDSKVPYLKVLYVGDVL